MADNVKSIVLLNQSQTLIVDNFLRTLGGGEADTKAFAAWLSNYPDKNVFIENLNYKHVSALSPRDQHLEAFNKKLVGHENPAGQAISFNGGLIYNGDMGYHLKRNGTSALVFESPWFAPHREFKALAKLTGGAIHIIEITEYDEPLLRVYKPNDIFKRGLAYPITDEMINFYLKTYNVALKKNDPIRRLCIMANKTTDKYKEEENPNTYAFCEAIHDITVDRDSIAPLFDPVVVAPGELKDLSTLSSDGVKQRGGLVHAVLNAYQKDKQLAIVSESIPCSEVDGDVFNSKIERFVKGDQEANLFDLRLQSAYKKNVLASKQLPNVKNSVNHLMGFNYHGPINDQYLCIGAWLPVSKTILGEDK